MDMSKTEGDAVRLVSEKMYEEDRELERGMKVDEDQQMDEKIN